MKDQIAIANEFTSKLLSLVNRYNNKSTDWVIGDIQINHRTNSLVVDVGFRSKNTINFPIIGFRCEDILND